MDTTLSREEKRKNKKKDRKKRMRKEQALRRLNENESLVTSDTIYNEKNEDIHKDFGKKEVLEPNSLESSLFKYKSLCQECNKEKTTYYCQNCNKCYCSHCYDTIHRALQKDKNEYHLDVIDIAEEAANHLKDKLNSKIDYNDNTINSLPSQLGLSQSLAIPKQKEKKQHHGLRCKKCFELLVHDDEFTYAGGQLFTNPTVLKQKGWYALHDSYGVVYCKNKHNVGRVVRATNANQGITFYRLTADKTTWKENYVDNPEFADSELIKDKPIGVTHPLMPCEYINNNDS